MIARTRAGRINALTVALGLTVGQFLFRLAGDGSLRGAFIYALFYFVPIFAVGLFFNGLIERWGWFEPGRVMAPRERQERARLAGLAVLPALVLSLAALWLGADLLDWLVLLLAGWLGWFLVFFTVHHLRRRP